MQLFKDDSGADWAVNINVFTLGQVKTAADVDLAALILIQQEELGVFLNDFFRLGAVLWVLCKKEALARNVSEEDFLSRFRGDVIDRARRALMREAADFFPDSTVRKALHQWIETSERVQELAREEAGRELKVDQEEVARKALAEIRKRLKKQSETSNGSPGSSQDLSLLTPTP